MPCQQTESASRDAGRADGLNLKEKSSGKHQGPLHITKRGPGVACLFLYLAALRLLQRDSVVRAWYAKKVEELTLSIQILERMRLAPAAPVTAADLVSLRPPPLRKGRWVRTKRLFAR